MNEADNVQVYVFVVLSSTVDRYGPGLPKPERLQAAVDSALIKAGRNLEAWLDYSDPNTPIKPLPSLKDPKTGNTCLATDA
eukprot:COSAG01_NODE_365_length_18082_cov_9.136518_14_plen_81_part_00